MRVKDPAAVKRWRERRGLSQRDLAMLTRCSQASISLIETGRMRTITEALALKIAKRLDVPWEDLFDARELSRVPAMTAGVHTSTRAAS
jgi:transcriptional regulator with XRE-family HTH domain